MKQLPQSKLAILETKAIMVESLYFSDVVYAIDKDGKGMWVLYGDREIRLVAGSIKRFCMELWQVWKLHGKKK